MDRWSRSITSESSPAQALLARSRREGLPLARLWEHGQATLSVGLNPRGKPGIWLVGRTR